MAIGLERAAQIVMVVDHQVHPTVSFRLAQLLMLRHPRSRHESP
jgi:hypothetical protein